MVVAQIIFLGLRQSGIQKFSNELPNSDFRNGGITRNSSKLFMIFFAISMKYQV